MQKTVQFAVFLFTPTFRTWPCQYATDKCSMTFSWQVPNTHRSGTDVCQTGPSIAGNGKDEALHAYEIKKGQVASEMRKQAGSTKRDCFAFLKRTLNYKLFCKLNNYVFTYRLRLIAFLFLTGQKVFPLLWWKNTLFNSFPSSLPQFPISLTQSQHL